MILIQVIFWIALRNTGREVQRTAEGRRGNKGCDPKSGAEVVVQPKLDHSEARRVPVETDSLKIHIATRQRGRLSYPQLQSFISVVSRNVEVHGDKSTNLT